MAETVICADCVAAGVTRYRPPAPGAAKNRCTTHHRAFKRAQRSRNHDKYMVRQYGLRPGEYDKLKESQGGKCGLCLVATGAARALALEHDHRHCEICATGACCGAPDAVRGIACSQCNEALGRFKPETLIRMARWLLDPPGPAVIRQIREEIAA